tara:strand:- start:5435 stop:6211 length:777 start_codon:yes stop_codon:yes gene_type:complete
MATAFDHIAVDYDRDFTDTAIGKLQRERVYHLLKPILKSNQDVLELNGGTGRDAAWLAAQVKRVLSTDLSADMMHYAASKYQKENLRFQPLDINALNQLSDPFDLIFSNFGGLNCLSPEAFQLFFKNAAEKLTDQGDLVAVIMGRKCLWEQFYFSLKGNRQSAFRRKSKLAVDAQVGEFTVPTWYYAPQEVKAFAQKYFTVEQVKPIGSFVPPSYLNPFFESKPALLKALNALENLAVSSASLANYADHYFIYLKKHA